MHVVARNIEIKARIESVAALVPRVAALADRGPVEIVQDDTFFTCDRGRLKLRAFSTGEGQLIFYQRPNQTGPKESSFVISPTPAPDSLREALSLAFGRAGRVRKHRTLYLIGRTRVHLDRVEDLGDFLELEVVLSEGERSERGVEEAHRLMAALGIAPEQLIEGAYVDLLGRQAPSLSRRQLTGWLAVQVAILAAARVSWADDRPVPDATAHRRWIDAAFAMKRLAESWGDQPYGAVVVLDGHLAGEGPSRVVRLGDADAHAEREAIRDAQRRLGRRNVDGSVLYSTSRPCRLCESAAAKVGVARMLFGTDVRDAGRPEP